MGGRGVEDGAKEKVLRLQAPVVQWVDSTTHWINLCLCPVDNAIGFPDTHLLDGAISLFNNRGQISIVWHISRWGLNKSDQQSPFFYGVPTNKAEVGILIVIMK